MFCVGRAEIIVFKMPFHFQTPFAIFFLHELMNYVSSVHMATSDHDSIIASVI